MQLRLSTTTPLYRCQVLLSLCIAVRPHCVPYLLYAMTTTVTTQLRWRSTKLRNESGVKVNGGGGGERLNLPIGSYWGGDLRWRHHSSLETRAHFWILLAWEGLLDWKDKKGTFDFPHTVEAHCKNAHADIHMHAHWQTHNPLLCSVLVLTFSFLSELS